MSEHTGLPVDRLGKLLRMLASTHNGEVAATVEALKRTLDSAGADLHVLADKIETERFTGVASRRGASRPSRPDSHDPNTFIASASRASLAVGARKPR